MSQQQTLVTHTDRISSVHLNPDSASPFRRIRNMEVRQQPAAARAGRLPERAETGFRPDHFAPPERTANSVMQIADTFTAAGFTPVATWQHNFWRFAGDYGNRKPPVTLQAPASRRVSPRQSPGQPLRYLSDHFCSDVTRGSGCSRRASSDCTTAREPGSVVTQGTP